MLLYAEEHAEEQELAEQAVDGAEMWIEAGDSILKIRYKLSLFFDECTTEYSGSFW